MLLIQRTTLQRCVHNSMANYSRYNNKITDSTKTHRLDIFLHPLLSIKQE